MTQPSYKITVKGDVIHAELKGKWSLAADLDYISALGQTMRTMRGKPWGLMVDMRGWMLTSEPHLLQDKSIAAFNMDRRNQVAECWLVNNDKQAESLVKFVQNHPGMKFARFRSADEASAWLASKGLKTR